MFNKLVFWCEFPEEVDWKKADDLFKDIKCEVYAAVESVGEYKEYKKKTKLAIYPWPVLSKKEGYWFSGFTAKSSIDKLKQYKGLRIKIDLEPPLPGWKYSNFRIICYGIKMAFKKGENNEYLEKVIQEVAGKGSGVVMKNFALINEFPFPLWYLKRQGIYFELKPNLNKNYMCYSTFAGGFFRPFVRLYLKWFMGKAVKENKDVSFSIGLINHGILGREGRYRDADEFRQDLKMVADSGCKNLAVYSLDGILKRDNPGEWVDCLRCWVLIKAA